MTGRTAGADDRGSKQPWRAEAEAHYALGVAASGQSAQDAARNAADT